MNWPLFHGTLVRMTLGHHRSSPPDTGKHSPARHRRALGSLAAAVSPVATRATRPSSKSENRRLAERQPSTSPRPSIHEQFSEARVTHGLFTHGLFTLRLIARGLCTLAVCAAIVVSLSACGPAEAQAGCGDYIRFRVMHRTDIAVRHGTALSGGALSGGALSGAALQAASPRHANPRSRMWFSTTLARSLGTSPFLPDDPRRTTCHGPACQRQPSSPLLPATALLGLFPSEALLFVDRLPEPPTSDWHVAACVASSPSFQPSDIFRPPR